MPILVLPPRQTPDANAIRKAAEAAGWRIEQLTSWRAPDTLRGHDLVLYGEPLFADVVTPALGLALLEPPVDWLVRVPAAYRQRAVSLTTLGAISTQHEPAFIKPAADKCFPARLYDTGASLLASIQGLPDVTPVLVAEPVQWEIEFRCFILERRVATLSPYLRNGALARTSDGSWFASTQEWQDARAYAATVVADPHVPLPPAVVVDVGRITGRGWAVVEANAAWGSGIYGCEAQRLLPVLRRASLNRNEVAPEDQVWVREQYDVESE